MTVTLTEAMEVVDHLIHTEEIVTAEDALDVLEKMAKDDKVYANYLLNQAMSGWNEDR